MESMDNVYNTSTMLCSDDNVYQGYPINLFVWVVSVNSIGYVVGIVGLGAVAVTVRVRSHVEAISFSINKHYHLLYEQNLK
jgi:hypothetical protein